MSYKILIVEDDKMTVDLIETYLEKERWQVFTADNGWRGIEIARETQPDLVILDLMLPQVDGLDVCRILRASSDVPIIMLTARADEEDILLGLGLGADDYMTKPFRPRELVARVRAVLRRIRPIDDAPELICGNLSINIPQHEVIRAGERIHLTRREFSLLETMAREPGRVFTRAQLLKLAFGAKSDGLERTVDYHIMNLRRKIEVDEAAPIYILTVFGIGYKFSSDLI